MKSKFISSKFFIAVFIGSWTTFEEGPLDLIPKNFLSISLSHFYPSRMSSASVIVFLAWGFFVLIKSPIIRCRITDELVVFKICVIFRVFVYHHVKAFPIARILDIEPDFLITLSPIIEGALFDIIPDLFQLLIGHDFSLTWSDYFIKISFDFFYRLKNFERVLDVFWVDLFLELTQFHWVWLMVEVRK